MKLKIFALSRRFKVRLIQILKLDCIYVESTLLVGDQCSCLPWITFVHEFTSPRTYTQHLFYIIFFWIISFTNEITSPRTRKMLSTYEHWPHTKKNDSTVICLKHFAILFMYFLIPHLSFCILFSRSKRESDK